MAATARFKVLAVIPARLKSTRFPGKVIAPLAGKPLIAHTYARTVQADLVSETVVAADDEAIVEALRPFGIPVVMTRSDHLSGTDRIAEIAENSDAQVIVNVQGDEPLIEPKVIDDTVRPLLLERTVQMATARRKLTRLEDVQNPNVVKVVCDRNGHALYFSRCSIPHIRDQADQAEARSCYWQHIGIYAYRRAFLLRYAKMPPTPLEHLEKLEQLRVLEHGFSIAVVDSDYLSLGVDSPEDLEQVRAVLERAGKDSSVNA